LEVGAEGGFKLDLRQDCDPGRQDRDPGKQKLKGAIRTETYQCHYCQQLSPQKYQLPAVGSSSAGKPWPIGRDLGIAQRQDGLH
jgi:hypothetical protein